jgi:hypothetical protein
LVSISWRERDISLKGVDNIIVLQCYTSRFERSCTRIVFLNSKLWRDVTRFFSKSGTYKKEVFMEIGANWFRGGFQAIFPFLIFVRLREFDTNFQIGKHRSQAIAEGRWVELILSIRNWTSRIYSLVNRIEKQKPYHRTI